jgi:gliding motility-associated-like protein
MNTLNFKYFLIIIAFFLYLKGGAQTLIMNEVSNGPSGSQEYVEFVVVSNTVTYSCSSATPPCIDIRGWIFDDNSGYHGTSGIAAGAVRFSNDPLWSCVPLGTIILIYNAADRNPGIPPDDLTMSDGNCKIIAPINGSLFEVNTTTPGASACSYPSAGWTPATVNSWTATALANTSDCARIVNLAGCEVFSVCYGATDNLNTLIYFPASGTGTVYSFNSVDPQQQVNWTSGSATTMQTPGVPNNAANAAYISQFNNGCMPITQPSVTAVAVNAGCTCNGSATANATGSIPGYTYVWYDASMNPIGQTAATATGLCAGVYNVIATSHIGCTATTSVTITSSSTTSVTVNSQTICAGTSAILTATPSTAGGTFSWSPGGLTSSSVSISPSSTTTYSVIYTLAGCSGTNNGIVTVIPLPTITVNSPTICAGQTTTLIANGASSYVWNTSSTTNPLTVSPTLNTNFTVVGTSNGCSNTAVSNVFVTPLPTVTVNSPTICTGQTATLTANGAATYAWSIGSTSNPLTVSPASNTSFTVIGTTNGCTNTAVSSVSVNPLPIVTVNSSTICTGLTATLIANGATTYTWNNGSTNSTLSDNPTSTTIYTVTGEELGCVSSATASIVINPNLSLSINTPTICSGQTTTLTSTGATTYTWSNGSNGNNIVVSPATTTSFSVAGSNGSCSGSTMTTVFVNPLPTVTVNSSTICLGQTASLTAIGASTYSWNTGVLSNTLNQAPIINTTYTVIGTTLGCTNTAIATISVTPLPTVTVNSSTICLGQTATLTASGANTYLWSSGAVSNILIDAPTTNTTYTVTGAALGCTNTAVATISVTPLPTVTVNSSTICLGQTATLNANGANSYAWNTGSLSNTITDAPNTNTTYTVIGTTLGCTNTAIANVSVVPIPTVTVNSSTICSGQTATLIASGANSYSWDTGSLLNPLIVSPISNTIYTVTGTTSGCAHSATTNVVVVSSPVLIVNPISICTGETATLSVSGASNYNWSTGATTNTVAVSPTSTTVYSVSGSFGGCTSTASVNITVHQLPIIAAQSKTICAGQTVSLLATGALNYNWNTGSLTNTTSVVPSVTTIYTVTGTSNGCSSSQTVSVVVSPVPNVALNASVFSGCAPVCVKFTDLTTVASGTITNWDWAFDDGFTSNLQNPIHCFDNAGVYDIGLTVTSSNGCSKTFLYPSMINVFPNPIAEFTSNALETDILNPIIDFTNLSTNATSYSWLFGDGSSSSNITNPTHTYSDEGVYTATLIATSQYGCKDKMIHDIIVKGIFTFYAPNTFTPNDDNKNDSFLPLGVGWDVDKYQLDIFDRWGNNCFSTKEVGKGWDGKANHGSESAQIDTYTWKVDLTDVFGKNHKYIGKVTIIR